jgi:hypothetical protein
MGLEERTQSKEIGGILYEVTPLPFGVGQKALVRLVKLASPVLSALLAEGGNKALAGAAAIKQLPGVLTEEDLAYFAKTFGTASKYQNDNAMIPLVVQNQELHFAGRYSEFFDWIAFSIEVNYGSFFGDLMRRGTNAVSGIQTQNQST